MALCPKLQVKLPEKGIIVAKSGKYPYVYHVDATFRNEKGIPDNKKRSIGKLDKVTGNLIPNKTYYDIYEPAQEIIIHNPQAEPVYGEVKSIGVVAIVQAILDVLGVERILTDILGISRYKKIMTVIAYMLTEGNVMQYIDDFCDNNMFDNRLSDVEASQLFASLSNPERMAFFKSWVKLNIQKEYIAYDVTSFSTYSKNIDDASYGYNRDKESLPQINLALYMGQTSLLPMFYVTYDGSIVDKSHFQYMMAYNAELDIENVSFVMDKGFATTDNAEFMRANGYPFIIGAEFRLKAIQEAFAQNRQNIQDAKNYILSEKVYGLAVKGRYYRIAATLHIFYDPASVAQQTFDFFRKLAVFENELSQLNELDDKQIKKYSKYFAINKLVPKAKSDDGISDHDAVKSFTFVRDNYKINETRDRLGYFFILTNKDFLTPQEVVSIYRRRDIIEKGFDEIKNGLDMNRLRTHSTETTNGKMFCAFLSLICRSHMQNRLHDFMDKHNFSNERVIRELLKIRAIDIGSKKNLLCPISKTQRDILLSLGLDKDIFATFINCLNL